MARNRHGVLTLRREDGRIISESVTVADTTMRRMRGLLGRGRLESGEGLLLRPAWSIHTAFMRFPIDVAFVDHDQIVIRIAPSLRPFKTASCRGAREVVELAAGECERRGLEVGDRVAWASRNTADAAPGSPDGAPHLASKGNILVASGDQRFVKLARFLLEGRGIAVAGDVRPESLDSALEDSSVDAVLLDVGDQLANGLRLSNSLQAGRPDVLFVLVGEGAAERTPKSVVVYDKWDQTDEAIEAIQARMAGAA